MDHHAQLSLPAATTSPTSARSFVRDRCAEWGLPELADDLALMASELVTNAVVHAGSPSIVKLAVANGAVELSVEDRDSREPEPRPHRHDLAGRGLLIIETLAPDWGITQLAIGKAVWVRVPVAAGRPEGARTSVPV